jgi:CRISPR-associated DxTHG motif protein
MSNEKQKKLLITFFGKGKNYQKTTYYLEDKEETTEFIAYALYKFLNPNKVLIFTTQEAINESGNYKEKLEEMIGKDKTETVLVPSGKDQKEQEEIFKKVLEEVEKYKEWEIYVDITHGLRSIPIISFTSLFYLKNFDNIKTSKIFYGNFEQKDEKNNRTPVIELTFLLDIIEWFNGVNMFVKRYEANELAHRLKLMVNNEKFLKLDLEQKII